MGWEGGLNVRRKFGASQPRPDAHAERPMLATILTGECSINSGRQAIETAVSNARGSRRIYLFILELRRDLFHFLCSPLSLSLSLLVPIAFALLCLPQARLGLIMQSALLD